MSMIPIKLKLSPKGQAGRQYRKSKAFKRLSDPISLEGSDHQRKFLENRIEQAYLDGLDAGERLPGRQRK